MNTTRRRFLGTTGAVAAAALLPRPLRAAPTMKPNVLFIIVDDLRPQLGCYGRGQMVTPHLDKLAAQGTLFERAYCQQAICAPSRISVLAGVRPDTTGIYDLDTPLCSKRPDLLTLPQLFKNNGYATVSLGKVYHHRTDDPQGWSQTPQMFKGQAVGRGYVRPENKELVEESGNPKGPATEAAEVPDNAYPNGALADGAIAALRQLKGAPFFLAVGFHKPHLPFCAPQKYWDFYRRDQIQLPPNYFAPKDAPDIALHPWGELRSYLGIPQRGPVSDDQARELIHGYYAGTSYTDAQIGRVLGELERLGLDAETLVVFCVDHGWSLGENSLWCKHSNFENAVHVPLIVRAPKQQLAGGRTRALCESLDIYPTLCDLSGLDKPAHLEGSSLAPLLKDPTRAGKAAAFSQYPRGEWMGYTMRTDRYRFTSWGDAGTELYDHQTDAGETVNLAARPENAALVEQLGAQLRQGLPNVQFDRSKGDAKALAGE